MIQEHQIVLDVHNELVTNLASLLTQTSPSTTAHPYNLHTPTWYYIHKHHTLLSMTSQTINNQKNLCSLLSLGLKFIPMPICTSPWNHIKQTPIACL